MRVCFINTLYPPYAKGGAERVVSEEARALKAQGHEVSVITAMPLAEDGDPGPFMTVEDGVRVHRFYPVNLFFYGEIGRHGLATRAMWHLWDMLNLSSASVVKKILKEEKPDVVHTHNLKGLGYAIPGMLRRLGVRHVHTLHDVQLAVPSGLLAAGQEEAPTSGAYAAATRMLFGSPDVVISPSRFLMDFYVRRGFFPRSERVLLPNPAPDAVPLPHTASKETRFLFLGQVERHKGVVFLVEAMKRLFKTHPDARLEIVGEGSAQEEAARAAGKELRIAFYGKKHIAKFGAMFAGADFTVVPSLCVENAPTVVGESFAYGVPVIAAAAGGAAERIKDGENGLVFKAGDAKGLLAALERACETKKEAWEAMSRAARRSAEPLTVAHHVGRLLRIYRGEDASLSMTESAMPVRYAPPAASAGTRLSLAEARRILPKRKTSRKPVLEHV